MQTLVTMTSRGAITVPAKLRDAMGLRPNAVVILEETDAGILIRPSVSVPVELYTEGRIAEFAEDDGAIGAVLPRDE